MRGVAVQRLQVGAAEGSGKMAASVVTAGRQCSGSKRLAGGGGRGRKTKHSMKASESVARNDGVDVGPGIDAAGEL